VTWELRQTRRFARAYKKLHSSQQLDVDIAARAVAKCPTIGERKKGDLSRLWVYKFNLQGQVYLLGYTREDTISLIYLEALGPHEKFYRDLKR